MERLPQNKDYQGFLSEVKERIHSAQYDALRAVNKELVGLYWDIGRMIAERQKALGWGKSVVEVLSKDLQNDYPGVRGFSVQNLWCMRQFYCSFNGNSKLQPLVGEISWAKNIIIMEKCKDDLEKEFYMKMTAKFGWTKAVLIHQIEGRSYEKYLLNQTNFDKAVPAKYKEQAKLAVKDEYTFDFLELGEGHSERELEASLMEKVRRFLAEMAVRYIGNQYRLEVGGKEFFIDLLLYHRKLKCLVAIELKVGDFKPEYAGKMQFYLSVLDDKLKLKEENPSIGLIICKAKNHTVVEYALRDLNKPMGVATYKITPKLPQDLSRYLPTKEQIAEGLGRLLDKA